MTYCLSKSGSGTEPADGKLFSENESQYVWGMLLRPFDLTAYNTYFMFPQSKAVMNSLLSPVMCSQVT